MRRLLASIVSASIVWGITIAAGAAPCSVDRTVRKIVAEEYGKGVGEVSPRDKFAVNGPHTIEDVEIQQMTEDKFHLKIPDEDWSKLVSVQDIADYVKAHDKGCG